MTIEINKPYTISMTVINNSGKRILKDSPILLIKQLDSDSYWNGMEWTNQEFQIEFQNMGNGVYAYDFTPDSIGDILITKKSSETSMSYSEVLSVVQEDSYIFDWGINTEYVITSDKIPSGTPNAIIQREKDNFYLDESGEWTEKKTFLLMQKNYDNSINSEYVLKFIPHDFCKYYISIITDTTKVYCLNIVDTALSTENSPIVINGFSFKNNKGENSIVVDGRGKPMFGVKITIYNTHTKKEVTSTLTDSTGNWSVALYRGKYYFRFDFDGYISKGFEKEVI